MVTLFIVRTSMDNDNEVGIVVWDGWKLAVILSHQIGHFRSVCETVS